MEKTAIITFLSQKHEKAEMNTYTVDGSGQEILGRETNDAPVKYLLKRADEDGKPVDRIICIVSKKVYEDGKADSAYFLFQKMVEDYLHKKMNFVLVPYDFVMGEMGKNKDISNQQEKALSVYRGINNALQDYGNVYIDYTGGFRDTSFLTTVLIRYLEFINISCIDIVYSNYNDQKIYSLLYIYDMFRLLNAVSQFVETGSGKLLNNIFNSARHEPTGELAESIQEFAQVIQLCNVREVDRVLGKLTGAIRKLEEYDQMDNAESGNADIQVEMFQELLKVIKKKFYMERGNVSLTYPGLIRWCVDNDLLQQALTLYVEKMPVVYYDKGMINKEPCDNEESSEADCFYKKLYAWVLREDEDQLYAFRKQITKVKQMQEKNSDYVRNLREVRNYCKDEVIKKSLNQLYKFLNENYSDINYKSRKVKGDIMRYGIRVEQNSGKALINSFENNSRLCYAFILDSEQELNEMYKYRSVSGSEKTYQKKIMTLEILSRLDDVAAYTDCLSKKELFDIMLYYLAIKYLRNHINHAAEDKRSSERRNRDEGILCEYMKEHGIEMRITPENVQKILLGGLKITDSYLS